MITRTSNREPRPIPTLPSRWRVYRDVCLPTLRYWMETEVHVYGFSIAANILLSFFPFLIVMVSLCRYVLHWPAAEQAIYFALQDFFPDELGDFLRRNLRATVDSRGPFQWASVLLLLFTANGIFEPLEVALNRAWGVAENRSFLKNQIVSFWLIFASGGLFLLSTVLTALNQQVLSSVFGLDPATSLASLAVFKLLAVPVSILMLFLIYWLLPNAPIPPRSMVRVAIVVGLVLEACKYLVTLLWPWLRVKLRGEYGPFVNSVGIILLGFFASMIVLAGAEWSARQRRV